MDTKTPRLYLVHEKFNAYIDINTYIIFCVVIPSYCSLIKLLKHNFSPMPQVIGNGEYVHRSLHVILPTKISSNIMQVRLFKDNIKSTSTPNTPNSYNTRHP